MNKMLIIASFLMLPVFSYADVNCSGIDSDGNALEIIFSQITTANASVKLHYLANSSFPMGLCHQKSGASEIDLRCSIQLGAHSTYKMHLTSPTSPIFSATLAHMLLGEPIETIELSCKSEP